MILNNYVENACPVSQPSHPWVYIIRWRLDDFILFHYFNLSLAIIPEMKGLSVITKPLVKTTMLHLGSVWLIIAF